MLIQSMPFPFGGDVDPPVAWEVDVTAASADVPSTLTNFPLLVHFETLGPDFWDNVTATGGDIRAEVGGSQVPFHLTYINTTDRKGYGFALVPSLSSSGDTTVTLYGDGSSSLPSTGSTYGRDAVWADYEGVWLLNGSLEDATGNGHTLTQHTGTAAFELVEWGAGGGFTTDGDTILTASGFPAPNVTTFGITAKSHDLDIVAHCGAIGAYATYGTTTDRVAIAQRDSAPDAMSLWDNTNDWLNSSGRLYTFETHRYHAVLNGTTARYLYQDGVVVATDLTTSVAEYDGTNVVIGGTASGGSGSPWFGELGFAYVRTGVLPTNWLAVETAMLEPGFLSVAGLPAVAPHTEIFVTPTNPLSSLTNFPYLIKLADLSPDFWNNVRSDGGDIRVYNGSNTDIPFHLVSFDYDARTGFLFAKQTIGTSGATFKLEVGYPARTALAANATYGTEAVWSDYQAVYFFNGDQLDATANSRDLTVKTGTAAYRTLLGLPALDTRAAAFQSSVDNTITPSAIYTMACTVSLDEDNTDNQQAMTFCQTYGSASNRSTLGNVNSGEKWTTFSADDSFLSSTVVVNTGVPVRLACTYNGSTARQLFVNGNLEATDATIVTKTMDTLVIGGGSSSAANLRGRIAFAYLRLAILSSDWLAYEASMIVNSANSVESLWVGGEA